MNISIATINIWGLPWPFSIHKRKRVDDCVLLLRKRNIDIVALQEVWTNWDVQRFRSAFPEYHVFAKTNMAYNPSGLMMLSRFPLLENLLMAYSMPFLHKEIPSRKGIMKVETIIAGKKISIINTQLYFGTKKELTVIQQSQVQQLKTSLPNTPTLLVGDFNMRSEQLEPLKNFSLLSDPSTLTIDNSTLYAQKLFNKIGAQDRTPDMIWANFPVKTSKTYAVKKPLISDHFPLVTHIEI